ncbi:uncharacterized protein LOC144333996 [Macaca mulatta]
MDRTQQDAGKQRDMEDAFCRGQASSGKEKDRGMVGPYHLINLSKEEVHFPVRFQTKLRGVDPISTDGEHCNDGCEKQQGEAARERKGTKKKENWSGFQQARK